VSHESETVSHLALDWLREVLSSEFGGSDAFQRIRAMALAERAPEGATVPLLPASAATPDPFEVKLRFSRGDAIAARWYRDWHRGWRRFQLSDRLQRYAERLLGSTRPEEIYQALTETAVQVVGGYTCVLFPPQESPPLRPIPNPLLSLDAGRLTISIPLGEPGAIRHEQVLEAGPLSGLGPLFTEGRAVSIAHAPFGEGGVILLLERRQERVFEDDDWEMLRVLSQLAGAALERVALRGRAPVLRDADLAAGVLAEELLEPLLDHALALAREGEALTLAALRLSGLDQVLAEDGRASVERVRYSAAAALRELAGALGIVLKRGADGFFLVLPRLNRSQALGLIERTRRQLPVRVGLLVGLAEYGDELSSASALAAATNAQIADTIPEAPCWHADSPCTGERGR
jgi:GGDEF domain-containing protein